MIQISNLTLPLILLAYGRAAALTISSTDPGSALRLAGFSFLAILAHLQFVLAPNFCTSGMWNGGVVFNCVFSIAYITHLLFLKGIDQSDLIEKPSDSQSVFSLAYNYIYNYRGIRTPWQVKNVPRFPLYYSKGSGPERWRFLLRQAAFVVWYYLVLDLASSLSAQETAEDRDRQYGHGLEYSYLNATAEQWTIRVVSSVATWYIMARVIIDMIYRATSLIFVGTGLSSPVDWPPFFGSVWDAYTLRNFWG